MSADRWIRTSEIREEGWYLVSLKGWTHHVSEWGRVQVDNMESMSVYEPAYDRTTDLAECGDWLWYGPIPKPDDPS